MTQGKPTRPVAAGSGFTLIELLCALALVATLLAIGTPQLHRLMATRAVASHVALFTSAMRYARSEAAKRGVPVTMCVSVDTNESEPGCAPNSQGGWQSGWVVFVDHDEIGEIGDADDILQIEQPLRASGGIESRRRYQTFQPNGIALNATGSYVFKAAGIDAEADLAGLRFTVCVNKQGRARIVDGVCA